LISAFFEADAGKAVYAVIAFALVDFAFGVGAAVRDNTFQLDSVMAFLRKHFIGRVLPIAILLSVGWFGHQDALVSLGLVLSAGYLAETLASIKDSAFPSGETKQPVPVD
jgi:hypothetical protein